MDRNVKQGRPTKVPPYSPARTKSDWTGPPVASGSGSNGGPDVQLVVLPTRFVSLTRHELLRLIR
ncbi:MAG: hypothetical protein AVDCRST_MAG49-2674 [uncultured Thermomicrobiales bacterium]|uniref:Uncharacterized protein n=1 Tax=uncultured Thermomicrobiales bacterium TaxID=1645740 RepID=A0A6J4UX45_9BACT|nr:MAG: hypothetical protein AVDCRST_MAG49-2674 [uncultured Thermomicrobiales bacterium]